LTQLTRDLGELLAKSARSVELRPVADLVPYANNAREHSKRQIEKLCGLIERFGFCVPVLVDANSGILAGHGRVLAAQRMGLDRVPVITLGHLSEDERRAFILADNRIAEEATWNQELLATELRAVLASGLGGEAAAFDDNEIEQLLTEASGESDGTKGAQAPSAPAVPVSQIGDVWLLGAHRILCGDSTKAEDVARVLAGEKPNLMVTDPPYGVAYDPSWRAAAGIGSEGQATGVVLNDHRADWRETWSLFPGNVAYVWHGGLHAGTVQQSLEACGFQVRAQIVWVKPRAVISRGHYDWQHEPAYYVVRDGAETGWEFLEDHELVAYAVREGEAADWQRPKGKARVRTLARSTVWEIEHFKSETGHGTQKPIECMRRPMINNSKRGDAVYEPFSGSGTTLIAAELLGRRCRAIELNPAYVDVAVLRWQGLTGKSAVLEESGAKFSEVAADRGVPLAA